jgi:hypothetical protein
MNYILIKDNDINIIKNFDISNKNIYLDLFIASNYIKYLYNNLAYINNNSNKNKNKKKEIIDIIDIQQEYINLRLNNLFNNLYNFYSNKNKFLYDLSEKINYNFIKKKYSII